MAAAIADPVYECTGQGHNPAAPCILVVDDSPHSRDLVERTLGAEGFETIALAGVQEARRLVHSRPVDLILSEARLEGRDGLDLWACLKSDRAMRDIPLIFLSSLDGPLDRLRGLRSGAVDYISKPFFAEELVARVRIHLRIQQAMRVMASQAESRLAELRAAQRSILVHPEDLPEAWFAVRYRPLGVVGGDVYDVVKLSEHLFGYFVADVSGHGLGASFLTSAVKALLRQYSGPLFSPQETMRGINTVMRSTVPEGQHLTATYARYYRGNRLLSVVTAGHPAPIHVTSGPKAVTYGGQSDPLGVFESVMLDYREIPLQPGDRFYLYTDGLIEDPRLAGGGREQGQENLLHACERRHDMPLAQAVRAISDDVRPAGQPATDDLLLVGVEVRS